MIKLILIGILSFVFLLILSVVMAVFILNIIVRSIIKDKLW